MQTSTIPRVAIYARISEDVLGDAAGVARQLDACRELADQREWSVVREISDNDVSAHKGKHRPGYEEILSLVRASAIDHVIVWQTSRLLRNRRERAEAIELFGRNRVGIIAVKGISFDLSTAYGRGQAGLLGEFDTMESEVKAERVAAAAAARARAGRPSGALGYGWEKYGTGATATYEVDPEQAGVVREIVDRLLAGDTLRAITADLNARGIAAPNSDVWGKTSVKKLALRDSNAAIRIHHRGQHDESRTEGAWPALIDPQRHAQVVALLSRPERRQNGSVTRPGARRHLLTWGVGECGVCGAHLRAQTTNNGPGSYGRPFVRYLCSERGCVQRKQAPIDQLVSEIAVGRIAMPDALKWLLGNEEEAKQLADEAETLRLRLDAAADMFAAGDITGDQLKTVTARLQPELERVRAELEAASKTLDLDLLQELAGPAAREKWDQLGVAQRRAVLEMLGLRVIINPTGRRGPGFDPDSITIEWRRA